MRMLAIQKSLACPVGPRILVPGRVFIKEGQLKKVSECTSTVFESKFWLFQTINVMEYYVQSESSESVQYIHQCFDPVRWMTGRVCGL